MTKNHRVHTSQFAESAFAFMQLYSSINFFWRCQFLLSFFIAKVFSYFWMTNFVAYFACSKCAKFNQMNAFFYVCVCMCAPNNRSCKKIMHPVDEQNSFLVCRELEESEKRKVDWFITHQLQFCSAHFVFAQH